MATRRSLATTLGMTIGFAFGLAPLVPAAGADVHVHIEDFAFIPNEALVVIGDAITWDNHDGATHTATDQACPRAGGPGPCEFDSLNMATGDLFSHTFGGAAAFDYECTIHGFTGKLSVADPDGTADLTATALALSQAAPVVEDPLTFTASVKNLGTAHAGAMTVRFVLDGNVVVADVDVPAVGALMSKSVASTPWTATVGDHTIQAIVDATGAVAETDEANNVFERTFHVDPIIRAVELTPEQQEKKVTLPGDRATYIIAVKNGGNRPDTYDLVIGPVPDGWSATTNVPQVTVNAGASANVALHVTTALVPLSGLEGDVSLTGRSQGDPAVADTASTHTRILL